MSTYDSYMPLHATCHAAWAHMALHASASTDMSTYDSRWAHMTLDEHIWLFMSTYDSTWAHMTLDEHIWLSMQDMSTYDSTWLYLRVSHEHSTCTSMCSCYTVLAHCTCGACTCARGKSHMWMSHWGWEGGVLSHDSLHTLHVCGTPRVLRVSHTPHTPRVCNVCGVWHGVPHTLHYTWHTPHTQCVCGTPHTPYVWHSTSVTWALHMQEHVLMWHSAAHKHMITACGVSTCSEHVLMSPHAMTPHASASTFSTLERGETKYSEVSH